MITPQQYQQWDQEKTAQNQARWSSVIADFWYTYGVSGFKAYPLFPFSDLQTFFSSFSLSLDIFIFSLA